jgi:hypothetical protein
LGLPGAIAEVVTLTGTPRQPTRAATFAPAHLRIEARG